MSLLLALARIKRIGCLAFAAFIVFVLVCGVGVLSFRGTFADDDVAIKAAQHARYGNVQVVKKSSILVRFFGCDEDDSVRYTVEATGSKGVRTRFYVCAGPAGAHIKPIR